MWRLLPAVLAVAFVARVAVVLGGDFIYHPDVVFQYLEPAWRLLTGDGLVVWEQFYGARSQLIPVTLALLMIPLQALGFDHPTMLRTALEMVLCGVSLLIPWGMYAFARKALDEHTGRVALVLGAAWWELVALAGQPLSEMIALSPLMWAFALAADVRSAPRARTLGFLIVVACALRLQYGPVALWLTVIAWLRMSPQLRRHFLIAIVSGIAFVGVFDLATVGAPLYRSYVANITFNAVFAEEAIALGLDLPWYFHSLGLTLLSGGLAVAAFTAGLLHVQHGTRISCVLWLLVPITVILVTHAMSPWKEYRHILVSAPLWLILLATVIRVLWFGSIARAQLSVTLVGAWFVAISAFGLLGKLPMQGVFQGDASQPVPLNLLGSHDPRLAFATSLAGDNGLVGLAEIGLNASHGLGFVHLGRAVRIFDGHTIDVLRSCGLSPRDYASHAIVPPNSPLPRGFEIMETGDNGWRLAKRSGRETTPPRPLTLAPVWIDALFGKRARYLFEGHLETDSWIARAWNKWVTEEEGVFPLDRFRMHDGGLKKAPKSRLEPPPACRETDLQISDGGER